MTELLLIGLIAALVGLNLKATVAVARDDFSEPFLKCLQWALIWLLPVLGAVLALAVYRPPEEASRRYREPLDAGEDYALSGRGHNGLSDVIDDD